MKLEKAIEILVLEASGSPDINQGNLSSAFRLGIEALKRLNAWRNDNDEDLLWDLPGETEE